MRFRIVLSCIIGLVVLVAILCVSVFQQPSWQGQPLSYWLDQVGSNDSEDRKEAVIAVSNIVSNSPMCLVEFVHTKDSGIKLWINKVLEKQALIEFRFTTRNDYWKQTVVAFEAIKGAGFPAVPGLLESYQSDDPDIRNLTVRLLQSIGPAATNAIPTLCLALSDENNAVVRNAAQALAAIGSVAAPEAVASLRPFLNDSRIDADTREEFLGALYEFGAASYPAIPELIEAMDNGDDDMLIECAQIIGVIGSPNGDSAIPALLGELDNPNTEVQSSVLEALQQFGPLIEHATPTFLKIADEGNLDAVKVLYGSNPPPDQILKPLLSIWREGAEQGKSNFEIRGLFAKLGEAAVPSMIPELSNTNQVFCKQMLEVLGNIGPKAQMAIAPVRAIIDDSTKKELHFKAAWELGRIDSSVTSIYPVLISALQSDNLDERFGGVVAFDHIRPIPEFGVKALIDRLKKEPHPYTRSIVAKALEGRNAYKGFIIPALIEALNDLEPMVRKSSLHTLRSYPDGLVQAQLKISSMLDDEDDRVRVEAIQALGSIGHPAKSEIQKLLSIMLDHEYAKQREQEVQQSVVRSMSRFSLPNPAREMRSEAASTLGLIGEDTQQVVPALIKVMNDDDGNLRANAAMALGRFRERASSSITYLKKALNDSSERVKKNAAIALALVNPITQNSINFLLRLAMVDEGDGPQFRAVEALEIIGPEAKSAIPFLEKLQQTTRHSGIKLRTKRALRSIKSEKDLE